MTTLFGALTVLAAEVSGQPAAAPSGRPPINPLFQLMPFVVILLLFFWFTSRSQKKREVKRNEFLDSLRPKDDVMTIGGIHGRVMQIKGDDVLLRIDADRDVRITIAKNGISRRVGEEAPEDRK